MCPAHLLEENDEFTITLQDSSIIHDVYLITLKSVTFLFAKRDTESPIQRKIYAFQILWMFTKKQWGNQPAGEPSHERRTAGRNLE